MAVMNKNKRQTNTRTQKKKYDKIYYNDGSGDNVPAIVGAMRRLDVNKAPMFVVK